MKKELIPLESLSLINCLSLDLHNRFNKDMTATNKELHSIRNQTIEELYRITGNKRLLNFKNGNK